MLRRIVGAVLFSLSAAKMRKELLRQENDIVIKVQVPTEPRFSQIFAVQVEIGYKSQIVKMV